MRNCPRDDEQRALAVFVDRYLPFARGEYISDLLGRRGITIHDIDADLNGAVRRDVVKNIDLAWPGALGADLNPFSSVGDALDFFDQGDLVVENDIISIPVGWQSRRMRVEVRLSETGLCEVRELISAAWTSIGQPTTDTTSLAGVTDGAYHCGVRSHRDHFRVHVHPVKDGSAHWVFRRLYVPKASHKMNFGFDTK